MADGAVWVAGVLAGQVDPNVMKRGALHVQNASKVPPGHVFVVGDSQMSLDSRYAQFGFVPLAQLQGLATSFGIVEKFLSGGGPDNSCAYAPHRR